MVTITGIVEHGGHTDAPYQFKLEDGHYVTLEELLKRVREIYDDTLPEHWQPRPEKKEK